MPPKLLNIEEGQKVVQEHLETFAEEDKAATSEVERRKTICNVCDYKDQHFGIDMCKDCYCFIKLKTALKNATCPLDKW